MYLLPVLKIVIITVWLYLLAEKDWKTRTLPNYLTLGGAAVILVLRMGWGGTGSFLTGLAGGMAAALLLLIPFLVRAAGGGDIKFLFAVGALAGFPQVFAFLFLICIAGVILGFAMILSGRLNGARLKHLFNCLFNFRYDRKKGKENLPPPDSEQVRIPFGTAIAAGTFIGLVLDLYIHWRGGA